MGVEFVATLNRVHTPTTAYIVQLYRSL